MTAVDGARLMASYDFGMVPTGRGPASGRRLTDRDLVVRVLAKGLDPKTVDLVTIATTKNIATIDPDGSLREAEDLMAQHRVKRLPVVEGDALVGVVALGDVAVTAASPREVGEAVAEISVRPPPKRCTAFGSLRPVPRRRWRRTSERTKDKEPAMELLAALSGGAATLLWIIAAILVIAGIVWIIRGGVLAGIVMIVVGCLVGPGGVSIFH